MPDEELDRLVVSLGHSLVIARDLKLSLVAHLIQMTLLEIAQHEKMMVSSSTGCEDLADIAVVELGASTAAEHPFCKVLWRAIGPRSDLP